MAGNGPDEKAPLIKHVMMPFELPADYEPAATIGIFIDRHGRVHMTAPWQNIPLCLHMLNAAIHTGCIMASKEIGKLKGETSESGLILPAGGTGIRPS